MRWYDPLPIMGALAVVSTVWLICYIKRPFRLDCPEWPVYLLTVALGTAWGSLAGFAVLAATT